MQQSTLIGSGSKLCNQKGWQTILSLTCGCHMVQKSNVAWEKSSRKMRHRGYVLCVLCQPQLQEATLCQWSSLCRSHLSILIIFGLEAGAATRTSRLKLAPTPMTSESPPAFWLCVAWWWFKCLNVNFRVHKCWYPWPEVFMKQYHREDPHWLHPRAPESKWVELVATDHPHVLMVLLKKKPAPSKDSSIYYMWALQRSNLAWTKAFGKQVKAQDACTFWTPKFQVAIASYTWPKHAKTHWTQPASHHSHAACAAVSSPSSGDAPLTCPQLHPNQTYHILDAVRGKLALPHKDCFGIHAQLTIDSCGKSPSIFSNQVVAHTPKTIAQTMAPEPHLYSDLGSLANAQPAMRNSTLT